MSGLRPPRPLALSLVGLALLFGAYNMYALLASSPLLPGPLAPFSVMQLTLAPGPLLPPSALLPQLLERYLGLGLLDAYRASGLLSFSLLLALPPLLAYLLTGSLGASLAAALAAFSFPPLYEPLMAGDYGLLLDMVLAQLAMVGGLGVVLNRGRPLVIAGFLALLPLLLGEPRAAYLLVPYYASLALIAQRRKEPSRLEHALSLLMGSVGLSLFFDPLARWGALPSLREAYLWAPLKGELALIFVAGLFCIAGLVALYFSRRALLIPLATWPLAGLALSALLGPSWLLLVLPSFAAIGSACVPLLKGLLSYSRQGEEVVLELQLEKALAAGLLVLLVLGSLFMLPGRIDEARATGFPGPEQLSVIEDVSRSLPGRLPQGAALLAPSNLAAWLGALAAVNATIPKGEQEAWQLDAATSTAFRMQTPYLMVDEWQPFSSRRSPFIYHYDGARFAELLHLDDGTNWMRVLDAGTVWPEDMHGMKLVSYRWEEGPRTLSLILLLWKKGFNVTKTIEVSKGEPLLTVSYAVRPNGNVSLIDMALPVYIEGRQQISLSREGDALVLRMAPGTVRISYQGASTPPALGHALQDYVLANFTARQGMINASVSIALPDARAAPAPVRHASFFDFARAHGFEYLLTYGAPSDLYFLSDAVAAPVEALEVKDSFNRVLLQYMGRDYVEAPADAQVVGEVALGANRTVQYRTAGLTIVKQVFVNDSSALLSFDIRPWKQNTTLLSFTFSAWISYSRTVLGSSCSPELRGCELLLDVGRASVVAIGGSLISASEGPDLVFGQRRVQLQFSLRPGGDNVTIAISFPGTTLFTRYIAAGRPVLQGEDVLELMPEAGLFRPIYQDELFHLYRVLFP